MLLIAGTAQAQFFPTPLPSWLRNIRSSENTWTLPQTFQSGAVFQGKTYIDSLILRIYLLDTGTSVVRSIIPQTTRLYNLGGSLNYWLNLYSQNLYADTVKSDIVFRRDVVIDSTLLVKGNLTTDSIKTIDVAIRDKYVSSSNQRKLSMYWSSDSTAYISLDNTGQFTNRDLYIRNNGNTNVATGLYLTNNTVGNIWLQTQGQSRWALSGSAANVGNFYPFADNLYTLGLSTFRIKNTFTSSINLALDSTGAKEDSVYVGRHTLLVNCTNADSNIVWLSDHNVTSGQRYMVKKIDANAINIIVKSKSGYPIDRAISKIWNTQYQTFTFVYRNKTWYIL